MKIVNVIAMMLLMAIVLGYINCGTGSEQPLVITSDSTYTQPDTSNIPKDKFGEMVRYGRELLVNTAYYIGPDGINGHYTHNKMSCTNCHQDAGTKPYSFSLMQSQVSYPQYRPREGRVLTLAERVNNCVMRPHSGIPLPLESREMVAILSYLKWINTQILPEDRNKKGFENLTVELPNRAGDVNKGQQLYNDKCLRCHAANGEGQFMPGDKKYLYPPLWGDHAYQPGSSMHRVIKQARWIKANMPNDSATFFKPFLTDEEAIDIASFVNDDRIHQRPAPPSLDYPFITEKAIDYGVGPFADSFPALQHKFGPYKPIIEYWKRHGLKPYY
jgi:thiosulfate dehydrogenase